MFGELLEDMIGRRLMTRGWLSIRSSTSTTILWGFSHGASHPSGTSSGIQSDPGTSKAIGGLGGVLGNAWPCSERALGIPALLRCLGGGCIMYLPCVSDMALLRGSVSLGHGVHQFRCFACVSDLLLRPNHLLFRPQSVVSRF